MERNKSWSEVISSLRDRAFPLSTLTFPLTVMTVAAETKVRHSERISLRGGLKDFAFALVVLVLLGCAIFITAWRRVAFIDVGYEIRRLEKSESEFLHLQHEMEIERAMLSSPERIEKVARARFGLREPEPGQIRVVP